MPSLVNRVHSLLPPRFAAAAHGHVTYCPLAEKALLRPRYRLNPDSWDIGTDKSADLESHGRFSDSDTAFDAARTSFRAHCLSPRANAQRVADTHEVIRMVVYLLETEYAIPVRGRIVFGPGPSIASSGSVS